MEFFVRYLWSKEHRAPPIAWIRCYLLFPFIDDYFFMANQFCTRLIVHLWGLPLDIVFQANAEAVAASSRSYINTTPAVFATS